MSSTTRSGTCTSPFAPIGKYRIGTPSRISTTAISSSVLLPPRKYSAWLIDAVRHHVAQRRADRRRLVEPGAVEGVDALQERFLLSIVDVLSVAVLRWRRWLSGRGGRCGAAGPDRAGRR